TQAQQGYWRFWLHLRHPSPASGDSYSSVIDNAQPLLAMGLLGSLLAMPFAPVWPLVLVVTVLLAAAQLPVTSRIARRLGYARGLCFAPLSFVRAFARGVGLTCGVLSYLPLRRRAAGRVQTGVAAVVLLLAAGLLSGGCAKKESAKQETATEFKRPNIVLITFESLRTDHVGCYGCPRDTTPAIDALAAEATLYEDSSAVTSWTLTSHATIFSGLYPSAHNVVRPKDRLKDSHRTMAEVLADYGYQTTAIVSGPYLKRKHGLAQGFETYDQTSVTTGKLDASHDVTNPRMEARVNQFLDHERREGDPFFLFLYYWDPHFQFIPPPPYDTMFVPDGAVPVKDPHFQTYYKLGKQIKPAQLEYLKAQYDGEIRCTDAYLERLFERLRALGLWENTVIILTADHGEQFFEHGFLGHKYDLYVESLHVPLIIKYPKQTEGRRDRRVVHAVDLFPTVLDLGRARIPEEYHGRSLLDDPRLAEEPTFFELAFRWYMRRKSTGEKWTESEDWFAIREGRHKLVWKEQADETELYDIIVDPKELHPIREGAEDLTAALLERLQAWRAEMQTIAARAGAPAQAVLTPEEEERLRSLGYLN
ncbi:MAG: sulfatase-like hydrolase/transferase, partial [bacterium]|nr:sulfatase-like hydrolase/transferase [bacterium]